MTLPWNSCRFDQNAAHTVASAGGSPMSLVLAAASSQYLSRTWGTTPTNANKATIAYFVKRASTGAFQVIYDGGDFAADGVSVGGIRFDVSDTVTQLTFSTGGGVLSQFTPNSVLSDTSIWHHICVAYDSTDAIGNNRCKVYIDGVEPSYATQTPPTQNSSFHLTESGLVSAIGRYEPTASLYLDAKLAYFYLIDGQTLTPSSFTTGTGSGTTSPITYAGTYGTNGFFLNFAGSNTNDQSGNSRNWTQNNGPTFSSDVPT